MTDESTEPTKMADIVAERVLTALKPEFDKIHSKLGEHTEILKAHTGELAAIRNVVDNELASQGQVDALEGHVKDVQRAARQNGKKIEKLAERMDRAQIHAK